MYPLRVTEITTMAMVMEVAMEEAEMEVVTLAILEEEIAVEARSLLPTQAEVVEVAVVEGVVAVEQAQMAMVEVVAVAEEVVMAEVVVVAVEAVEPNLTLERRTSLGIHHLILYSMHTNNTNCARVKQCVCVCEFMCERRKREGEERAVRVCAVRESANKKEGGCITEASVVAHQPTSWYCTACNDGFH